MFLNLLMLAGITGAAVPVVLHLLSRARYRTVDWGAMMFLADAAPRQQQRARLKQLLLLLVRMAIIALLAMALARPVLTESWGAMAGDAPVAAAVILDRSASTAFIEGGRTRLDAAKDAVLQVLSSLKREDEVALILIGDGQDVRDVRFSSDLQAVAARVADVTPGSGSADVADALSAAADALERFPHADRRIYVVTDRQATSWQGVTDDFAGAWSARTSAAGEGAIRTVVVPVGGQLPDNVAVESIALSNPPAIARSPAEVEVTVRNHGALPRTGLPLRLRLGEQVHTTSLNLPAGAASTARFTVTFPAPGEQVLAAEVTSEGMTADDRLEHVVEVIEPIKVLIVSGDERDEPFRSESDFLKLALTPYQFVGRTGPAPATVEVKRARDWTGDELSAVQVVVLANIPELTPQQVRALDQFVFGGGGLLVAPGSLVRADSYNRTLYRDGSGVLPAAIGPAVAADGSAATSLLGLDLAHPVFHFLKGRPDPVPSATVTRYVPSTPNEGAARVLGTYASGQPFLVEATSGHGRVLLLTTPLDADWSTLPLTNFYLPFVQSAVRYLAAGGVGERNLEPGQEIRAVFPQGVDESRVRVFRPDGRDWRDVVSLRGRSEVRVAETQVPGVYRLRARVNGQDVWRQFVVRPPKEESDLSPVSDERWAELGERIDFELVDAQRDSLATALAGARADRELWIVLLSAVLVLAVVEMGLTRFWQAEGRA